MFKIIFRILQQSKACFRDVGAQTLAVARFALVPCFTNTQIRGRCRAYPAQIDMLIIYCKLQP